MKSREEKNDDFFTRLRKKEFGRLDKLGHVYLDYTGGNVYPQSLVNKHYHFLRHQVFGNPHSTNPASMLSEKFVKEARTSVLSFFNAHDYYCIFTPNATRALQIVGECYPFSSDSHFLLTADNHNSVNGIREYCRKRGGSYTYCRMNYEDLTIHEQELNSIIQSYPDKMEKLFAYPAQSNVSGAQHSLEWIKKAHDQHWDVLVDAAAFVPTSKLDLSVYRPDFVSLSFYKMFGYPTGIGCLLVRKDKFAKLKKPSYAGGTITLSSVAYNSYFLKNDHEKFEDGTINYLGIPAIKQGLEFIGSIGMENIHRRIKEMSQLIITEFNKLKHENGRSLIKLYGTIDIEKRGGTFLFNVMDREGQPFPFQYLEKMAIDRKISFRTGCFCNPGIDELNHCLSSEQLKNYFTSRNHGDYFDFIQYTGKMRGAVRISIGFPTNQKDLTAFFNFISIFLNQLSPAEHYHSVNTSDVPSVANHFPAGIEI